MDKAVPAALLLVEDDQRAVDLYSMVLAHAGFRTISAVNADEAFACAAASAFDLAIVDVRLPGLSGIDAAKRLLDEWGIPSLFVSALDDRQTVDNAVAAGALGYLVKPIMPQTLSPAVEAAVARARDLKTVAARSAHLERALESSRAISLAIGAIMALQGLTEEEAFEHLRALARSRRKKVVDIARQLVGDLPKKPDQD